MFASSKTKVDVFRRHLRWRKSTSLKSIEQRMFSSTLDLIESIVIYDERERKNRNEHDYAITVTFVCLNNQKTK